MSHFLRSLFAIIAFVAFSHSALAETVCNQDAVFSTTTPSPPRDPNAVRNARAGLARMPAKADWVLLGDSIFEGWPKEFSVSEKTVWNFAVGGDKTQNILWRLENKDLEKLAPVSTFLLVGTNNLSDPSMEGCAITAGVAKIVEKVHQVWPSTRIFVLSIAPKGADFLDKNPMRLEINHDISALGQLYPYVVPVMLDDLKLTCGQYGKSPLPSNTLACSPASAYVCPNYKADHLHFEMGAYEILNSAMKDAESQVQ